MGDLIDRQAALDKINEQQRKLIYCFGFENDMVKIMDIAKSIITAIPPVQPDHNADVSKKVERTAESAQSTSSCAHENDVRRP